MLHDLYTRWDALASRFTVAKVTTIGDAYIAVAGPSFGHTSSSFVRSGSAGAVVSVRMAVLMIQQAQQVIARRADGSETQISVRVGLSTGRVFGGVLGTKQFQWQAWGNGLADAIHMEETGKPGTVHVSQVTRDYFQDAFEHEHYSPQDMTELAAIKFCRNEEYTGELESAFFATIDEEGEHDSDTKDHQDVDVEDYCTERE